MLRVATAVVLIALLLTGVPAAWGSSDKPDLAGSVYVWWTTPDTPQSIVVNVYNRCDIAAAAFDVDVYLDGDLFERVHFAEVSVCTLEAKRTTRQFAAEEGALHELRIVIDPDDVVDETDETNNEHSLWRMFTNDRPDLVLSVSRTETSGWPLTHLTIEYEVCNVGTRATEAAATVWGGIQSPWSRSGGGYSGIGSNEHGTLDAGACLTGQLEEDLLPDYGEYRYWLMVDLPYEAPLRESDSRNNDARGAFFVGPSLPHA